MKNLSITIATGFLATLSVGIFQPAPAQAQAMQFAAKAACGGAGEKSCWNVNPKKWCDAGLVYVPGGVGRRGRCLKPSGTTPVSGGDPTPNCGGKNQKSCWSLSAKKWCDPGLIYKPGGLPGKGTCRAPAGDNMVDYTRSVASRYQALSKNNELSRLRKCVNKPSVKFRMIAAMKDKSTNSTNALLRECKIDIAKLQQVAGYVLNQPRSGNGARSLTTLSGNNANVAKKFRLFFEFSAGAAAGSKDFSGTLGYAIPLHSKPKGSRWYSNSMDYVSGFDLGFGGDIFVGLGYPGVPSGNNVSESGQSGVVALAAVVKVGMLTRITDQGDPAFGLFGGAGLGVTAATFDYTNAFFTDK